MEPRLILQFAQHQTTKAMWQSLTTTFRVHKDPVQVYDLEDRTNKLVQGKDSLETYWEELQNLWVSMDNRKPCPYTCCDDAVRTYRKETETKRLYQFLSGLNERYDGIRRELFKEDLEPSPETAFGVVKQEENRGGFGSQIRPRTVELEPDSASVLSNHHNRHTPDSPVVRHQHRHIGANHRTTPPPLETESTSQKCIAHITKCISTLSTYVSKSMVTRSAGKMAISSIGIRRQEDGRRFELTEMNKIQIVAETKLPRFHTLMEGRRRR